MRILITGASGTIGRATLAALAGHPRRSAMDVIAAQHEATAPLPQGADRAVPFDFQRPETHGAALDGVDRVLLIRPPHLADAERDFGPFIAECAARNVHVVFLSLQGAEKNRVVPHARIEALLDEAGVPRCFLRPSFFMQNLTAAHLAEIRDRDEIDIPAGAGRTAFIDARDIGDVAALALAEPDRLGPAEELTGAEALTYAEVATILSDVLGRPIRYRRSSLSGFIARRVRQGDAFGYAAVMGAIYSVARLGRAGRLTDRVPVLLGRPPRAFRQFAQDHANLWQPR